MQKIVVKSPTRVDLAGGTLDLWPLYLFIQGASTVNVAVSIYTTAEITPHDDTTIELESVDLKIKKSYKNLSEALADSDPKMALLQTQLRYWKPQKGFSLKTSSESPVGGGLGGSSSLTISLMKAFSQFCGRPFKDVHHMVHVAHNIEAEMLNTPTGTQDYYPAASGGINLLHYDYDGIEQMVLPIQHTSLAEKFMLVYTGKAHHSGLNNFEVMKDSVAKDAGTLQALKDLKLIALETELAVRSGKWDDLGELFRREFDARVRLAPEFSSPEIRKLAEVSLQNGAEAVKICGAGGGGCVLVWCPPHKREGVALACQKAGFQVMDAKPVDPL
ncbi:galactokinase [Bdellovibrio bacteriovorus]|uniref:Galactokinase n=1 Tax=Bdellovibrio bacteriovorus TaxID=959 RepID=A0A150WEX8_BDEBC|nr:galactokinase [Bdellovibrio bacteriovorus]KYG61504.1 galactokinase [Bdellovibrio bacteriovorus]